MRDSVALRLPLGRLFGLAPRLIELRQSILGRGPGGTSLGLESALSGRPCLGSLRAAAVLLRGIYCVPPGSRPAGSRRGNTANRPAASFDRSRRLRAPGSRFPQTFPAIPRPALDPTPTHRVRVFLPQGVPPTRQRLRRVSLRRGGFSLPLVHRCKVRDEAERVRMSRSSHPMPDLKDRLKSASACSYLPSPV
jgi:hypothetical protein